MSTWSDWVLPSAATSTNWSTPNNALLRNGLTSDISYVPNFSFGFREGGFGLETSIQDSEVLTTFSLKTRSITKIINTNNPISDYSISKIQQDIFITVRKNLQSGNVIELKTFNFEIDSRSTPVELQARIQFKKTGSTFNLDYGEMRVRYSEFIYPWTTPTPKEIGAFEAKIDSTIGTYASPSISERGIVISTSPNPTTSDTKVIAGGASTGAYTTNLPGLSQSTQYYIRSYVIDTGETYYSDEINFTTRTVSVPVPTIFDRGVFETKASSSVDATLRLTVTGRGFVLATTPNPTTANTQVPSGTGNGDFQSTITSLTENTTYYIRAYLIHGGNTFYSDETSFTTRTIAISHVDATEIKALEATITATIDPELRINVTDRGFIWSTSANPTFESNVIVVGDGDGEFSTTVSGLTPEREVFYRAYIKYENSPEVTFTTGVLSFVTLPQVLVPKTFFYRFFSSQLVYQHSFRKEGFEVETKPEFTWKINGGMGLMGIEILAPVEDFIEWTQELANTVAVMQCVVHDSETSDKGRVLYTGVAADSRYNLTGEGFIKLDGFKYAHAGEFDLNKKQLQDISGNTRISYSNMDFGDIYRDLIDKYQLQGALCDYTDTSIRDVGLTLSITFQNESFLDAMKRLAGFLPERWYFYIDGNNIFHLNQTNLNEPDHAVTIGKEVSSGYFTLSFADIVNDVYFNGGDTGSGFLYRKRTLQSSITQYGIRADRVSDERVTVPETADLRMEQIIRTKGQPIRYIEFTVEDGNLNRSGYDIESLKVGDSIQVLHPSLPTDITRYQNSAGTVGNAVYNQSFYNYDVNASLGVPFQIQEIKYEGNKAIIRSSDVITNQAQTIRQLQKQQLVQSTINSPDAPSS